MSEAESDQEKCIQSEKAEPSPDADSQKDLKPTVPKRSSLGRCFWVIVLVACAVVIVRVLSKRDSAGAGRSVGRIGGIDGGVAVKPVNPDANAVDELRKRRDAEMRLKLEEEKLLADIDVRYKKYKSDVAALVEKYRKMLPLSEGEFQFGKAKAGVEFIASKEGLCGYKTCACLAYKIAYDWVKDTDLAERAIQPVVAIHIVEPITNAVNVYSMWTAEFRRELQAEDQAFSLDLALRSHKFKDSISVLDIPAANNLSSSVDRLVADVREHAKEAAFAGVSVAVEAAFIRSSYVAIRKLVVKISTMALKSVAKKMVGTATAAATSAVADGPLPIGDIVGGVITIGGLTWTAYDIYNVTKTMPEELKKGVMVSVYDTRQKLLDNAAENLTSESDACLKSAEARVAALTQMLK